MQIKKACPAYTLETFIPKIKMEAVFHYFKSVELLVALLAMT